MAYEEELGSIVTNICQTMLGWEVVVKTEASNGCQNDSSCLCGNISITGAWQGEFFLKMPLSLAQKATEAMFASAPGSATEDEVRDVLGELTNMVSGSFKSMLEGNCQLSLPSVLQGNVVIPRTEQICHLMFETQKETFEVTVLQGRR
ncbi:MAG: chemotaxis protein CheX [Deltaproteobacteria bacterium]|nr:chemotaxis protein CheX [Deltaproteobacteria bacterium]